MRRFRYPAVLILLSLLVFSAGCQYLEQLTTESTLTSPEQARVTFLDVGQGDSILVEINDKVMLIDAGRNAGADELVATLENMGVDEIDVLVGTHPHEDHIGGLDAVIDNFNIGLIYMPDVSTTTVTFKSVLESIQNKGLKISDPVPGTDFELGPAVCYILAPNSDSYQDLNNYSIVIRMVYNGRAFLFEGDAETDSEEEILEAGYELKSDVLKVGHHGSYSSTSEEFLSAVSPQYAVISVGADNDYGHPHQETLDKLNMEGIRILRTDQDGTVTFSLDGSVLDYTTGR